MTQITDHAVFDSAVEFVESINPGLPEWKVVESDLHFRPRPRIDTMDVQPRTTVEVVLDWDEERRRRRKAYPSGQRERETG